MKYFPEEKAQVIRDFERLQRLFIEDRLEFDSESKKAIQGIIDQAESEERKHNLIRLQETWNQALNR